MTRDFSGKCLSLLYAFILCFGSSPAFAVDPGLDWKTIESKNLYVHYAAGHRAFAERALAIAESAHQRLTAELEWSPAEKTHIVLSDETDGPNGYATPLFFNRTVLFIAPPSNINTLEDFDDWFSTLIFHEYTHIVHLDKSAGSPEYLRKVFGRFMFLFPNIFQPAWVTEGLATYKETYPERGIGRGQSTMFASMMRAEINEGLQPVTHINLPVSTWPAGTTRYLYGVYFMRFIAERYGEEKLQQWINEYSNNLFPFFINTNAGKVFDKNLESLWEEYRQWLQQHFNSQIAAIRAEGIKAGTPVSEDAYRTDSVRAVKTGRGEEVYFVRNGGYKRPGLMRINARGETRELVSLNGSATIDPHPKAGVLLSQDEFCNNYTVYKDIYLYRKEEGVLERLTECARYLYPVWFPDGRQIAAVHHDYSRMALVLLDDRARQKDVLWQAEDGDVIGQIDVSPDANKIIASLWRRGSGWNLELFDMSRRQWKKITTGSNIAAYPQFTESGDILFSYENNGAYNLYRYNLKTDQIEQLTNLVGGAFQVTQASDNSPLYYTGYTAEGYAIYRLDERAAVKRFAPTELFNNNSLQRPAYKTTEHAEHDYSALSNMYPRWWFPVLGFSGQQTQLGMTTAGNDALGIQNYAITAGYDTKLGKSFGSINYRYIDRLFLSLRRINEITLDSNNEFARLTAKNTAGLLVATSDYYMKRQYNYMLGTVLDVSREVETASGLTPLSDFEDKLLVAGFLYNSTEINPLSISDNDGMKLRLVAEDSDALDADYSGQVYTLDWRAYLRTGRESVFALRFLQGWGTDAPRPFKLGGEGFNEDAISVLFGAGGEPVFNARNYALRGYPEGRAELVGRRAQLLNAEWRFPFQRIENGIMAPPIGLMQWFGNIFVETGSAYNDSPETYYSSAGLEVTADINVFYGLVLRTRLGYAHGFDKNIGEDRVYLKIGSSF